MVKSTAASGKAFAEECESGRLFRARGLGRADPNGRELGFHPIPLPEILLQKVVTGRSRECTIGIVAEATCAFDAVADGFGTETRRVSFAILGMSCASTEGTSWGTYRFTLEMGKILAEGLGEVQEMIDIGDFAVGLRASLRIDHAPRTPRPPHVRAVASAGRGGRGQRLQFSGGGVGVERA